MQITYKSSVRTDAGWRPVEITAEAERVSPRIARVLRVVAIDGRDPVGTLSRTGARRQECRGSGIAAREGGARKSLSFCLVTQQ